ncbi:hypothetical protein HispidOSU_020408 [Sigmodon hispidus]
MRQLTLLDHTQVKLRASSPSGPCSVEQAVATPFHERHLWQNPRTKAATLTSVRTEESTLLLDGRGRLAKTAMTERKLTTQDARLTKEMLEEATEVKVRRPGFPAQAV